MGPNPRSANPQLPSRGSTPRASFMWVVVSSVVRSQSPDKQSPFRSPVLYLTVPAIPGRPYRREPRSLLISPQPPFNYLDISIMLMIVHPRPAKRQPFNCAPPIFIGNKKENSIFGTKKVPFNYAPPPGRRSGVPSSMQGQTYSGGFTTIEWVPYHTALPPPAHRGDGPPDGRQHPRGRGPGRRHRPLGRPRRRHAHPRPLCLVSLVPSRVLIYHGLCSLGMLDFGVCRVCTICVKITPKKIPVVLILL